MKDFSIALAIWELNGPKIDDANTDSLHWKPAMR